MNQDTLLGLAVQVPILGIFIYFVLASFDKIEKRRSEDAERIEKMNTAREGLLRNFLEQQRENDRSIMREIVEQVKRTGEQNVAVLQALVDRFDELSGLIQKHDQYMTTRLDDLGGMLQKHDRYVVERLGAVAVEKPKTRPRSTGSSSASD